jgi:hypothetical protein
MRKITEEAMKAFYNNERFKKSNTEVCVNEFSTQLKLYGHTIATLYSNKNLEITTWDYNTSTARERLNGLKGVTVRLKLGQLYLNNNKWDGKLITIYTE